MDIDTSRIHIEKTIRGIEQKKQKEKDEKTEIERLKKEIEIERESIRSERKIVGRDRKEGTREREENEKRKKLATSYLVLTKTTTEITRILSKNTVSDQTLQKSN